MRRTEHLVDLLGRARVESPGPGHVEIQRVCIGRESHTALFQHPPSRILFEAMRLGREARFAASLGIKKTAWKELSGEIVFEVLAHDPEGRVIPLFKRGLHPRERAADRAWIGFAVDLPRLSSVRLELRTSPARGRDCRWGWAAWGDPRVEHDTDPIVPARRSEPRRHVFLITADALGADRMELYGAARGARTPHLAGLAADGALFTHARAQCPATLGSYASLLSSRHVPEHGVKAEWGRFPAHMLTLPVLLHGHGYHTAMIASQAELSDPRQGFSALFDEAVPCLANPAQEGAVTTRQFERWLDRHPDRPCFAWIQYFDAHPPNMPPEPYRSMYYQGDPARGDDAALVARIRGIEAVQQLEQCLPLLETRIPDHMLALRLRATGEALIGKRESAPDLATLLPAMGEKPAELGPWLLREAGSLLQGTVTADLVAWVRKILPRLKGVEAEILAWLEGVNDYRYPVSQHLGCISYLDSHIGRFVEALRERGLYEDSVILFVSPHGEVFGSRDIHFHHHVLHESVLRVPLVLKPHAGAGMKPGARIDGVVDSVDLFPTVLQLLGLPVPSGLAGIGRWGHVIERTPVPDHPSVAVGNHGFMTAWCEGGYKLLKVEEDHAVSGEWKWRKGDRALFDLREVPADLKDRRAERPDIAERLEGRLGEWLRLHGKEAGCPV